jgi:hypothetical protein
VNEPVPVQSSLTRIHQRLGVEIFELFFERVVDLCREAGLVWGRELFFAAIKIEANAGIPSLVPRFHHAAKPHLTGLFDSDAPDSSPEAELPAVPSELPVAPPVAGAVATDELPWRRHPSNHASERSTTQRW